MFPLIESNKRKITIIKEIIIANLRLFLYNEKGIKYINVYRRIKIRGIINDNFLIILLSSLLQISKNSALRYNINMSLNILEAVKAIDMLE
jgi:hypothetical protein